MKKFLCNLIVPALMFASLLTLPLWAGKVIEKSSQDTSVTTPRLSIPAVPQKALVAQVVEPG